MLFRSEVNLSRQVLLAFDGGKQVFSFDCVSGDSSHATPLGHWRVNSKHRYYTSHKYHVRMDYAMFFTTTGEAIHQSHLVGPLSYLKSLGLGFVGSHGCVRLAPENAAILFGLVQKAGYKNSSVSIKGGFFDTSPSLTTDGRPRKPFRWFWEKPDRQLADDELIKPMLKKKKTKKVVILGGKAS